MGPEGKHSLLKRNVYFDIKDDRFQADLESICEKLAGMPKDIEIKNRSWKGEEDKRPTIYVPMADVLIANPAMPYILTGNEVPSQSISEGTIEPAGTAYGKKPNCVMIIDLVEQHLVRIRDNERLDEYTRKSALRALKHLEAIVQLGKFKEEDARKGISLHNGAIYFQTIFKETFLPKGKIPNPDDEDRIVWAVYQTQDTLKEHARLVIISDLSSIRKKAVDLNLNAEACRYEAVRDPLTVFGPPSTRELDAQTFSTLESAGYIDLTTLCKARGLNEGSFHENEVVYVYCKGLHEFYTIIKGNQVYRVKGFSSEIQNEPKKTHRLSFSLNSGIVPTPKQQAYMEILLDPSISVVSAAGRAGTGKLMCAMLAGIVGLSRQKYSEIWYTHRSPKSESGNWAADTEKIAMPAIENLKRLISDCDPTPEERKAVRNKINSLIEQEYLRITPPRFVPGFELRNAFWIYDGGQYTNREEMKEILLGVGNGSKLVVIGNPEKVGMDLHNPALNLTNSGLTHLIAKLKGQKNFAYITFQEEDLSRGPGFELSRLI